MTDPWLAWAWLWMGLLGLMCLGAWLYNALRPRWTRRLRRLEAGRKRQAAEWQDRQDAERRKAAEWVKNHCFWSQP
jgi:hypothetical protein